MLMCSASGYVSAGNGRVTLSLAQLFGERLETELDERQQRPPVTVASRSSTCMEAIKKKKQKSNKVLREQSQK